MNVMAWNDSKRRFRLLSQTTCIVLFVCCASMVRAQTDQAQTAVIDETVVTETRSPRLWRLNIERTEDDVYLVFKRLVDNDDYEVECHQQ